MTEARAAKLLIGLLLGLKLGITAWNAHAYDATSYDYWHHVQRAEAGGLVPGTMNYDGPLYYLPVVLFKDAADRQAALEKAAALESQPVATKAMKKAAKKKTRAAAVRAARKAAKAATDNRNAKLMAVLRATNVLYIALFYVCWVCISLPRLLPGRRSWFLASGLLLALPGYQKLGAMSHADNLFAATSAVCAAVWLVLHRRARAQPAAVDKGWWLLLPVAVGLVGMSRPFAVVPVAVFSAVAGLHVLHGRRSWSFAALSRLTVAAAIAGTLSVSWYAYRWANSGSVTDAYKEGYIGRYVPYREDFDFVAYFTTFRIGELLETPNRRAGPQGPSGEPRMANSFFTLLYSETWGDHWLHFSGPTRKDHKVEQKRLLLALALPVPLLLLIGVARSARELVQRKRAAVAASVRTGFGRLVDGLLVLERETVIAVWLAFGAALYLYWQTGPALLPGKNSSVKFIYVATLYPLAIALATWWKPGKAVFYACAAYLLLLYVASLPVVVFIPS